MNISFNFLLGRFWICIIGLSCVLQSALANTYNLSLEPEANGALRVSIAQNQKGFNFFEKTLQPSLHSESIKLGNLGKLQFGRSGIEELRLNAQGHTINLIGENEIPVFYCGAEILTVLGTLKITREGGMNLTGKLNNLGELIFARGDYLAKNLFFADNGAQTIIPNDARIFYGNINNLGKIKSLVNLTINHESDVMCLGTLDVEGTLTLNLIEGVNLEVLRQYASWTGEQFVNWKPKSTPNLANIFTRTEQGSYVYNIGKEPVGENFHYMGTETMPLCFDNNGLIINPYKGTPVGLLRLREWLDLNPQSKEGMIKEITIELVVNTDELSDKCQYTLRKLLNCSTTESFLESFDESCEKEEGYEEDYYEEEEEEEEESDDFGLGFF